MLNSSCFRSPLSHADLGIEILSTPIPESSLDYLLHHSGRDQLWTELHDLGPLIVQVRHRYARLITRTTLPAWGGTADEPGDSSLTFRPAAWATAVLRRCACPRCKCPPSVRIHDAQGGEFLQVCAPPELSRSRWRILDRHFAAPPASNSVFPDDSGGAHLAVLPSGLTSRWEAAALPLLLASLSAHDEPLHVSLTTPGATLSRFLRSRRLFSEDSVLTFGDTVTTLQIALPVLHGLALENTSAHAPRLHLVGPGETSLLTLAPARGRPSAYRWQALLADLRA